MDTELLQQYLEGKKLINVSSVTTVFIWIDKIFDQLDFQINIFLRKKKQEISLRQYFLISSNYRVFLIFYMEPWRWTISVSSTNQRNLILLNFRIDYEERPLISESQQKLKMVDSQKFWHVSDCLTKSTNYGCWLYFTNHPLNFKLSLLCKQLNGWLEQSFSKNRFHISEIKFNWVELGSIWRDEEHNFEDRLQIRSHFAWLMIACVVYYQHDAFVWILLFTSNEPSQFIFKLHKRVTICIRIRKF